METCQASEIIRPWQVCLEEAWDAYCAGSLPIGACVVDATGTILSRGRNRIEETQADVPYACGNTLAHAELNALLALKVDRPTRHAAALYTTTEPCPLCLGAFYMSSVRTLHYAARESFAGSTNLLGTTPYLSRKPIRVYGPAEPVLEALVTALAVEFELGDGIFPTSAVLQSWRETIPAGVMLGEQLYQNGELRRMKAENWTAMQVVAALREMLSG
ncbi:MAG TPA: nucleoside deaminase [Anaerolineales bacterium]|nr:nucleoside deaminase [Anaerolineales bacterium]